jgi:hypothetical protein
MTVTLRITKVPDCCEQPNENESPSVRASATIGLTRFLPLLPTDNDEREG